jgi:hypothetical protein
VLFIFIQQLKKIKMKKLINNALHSLWTTIAGSVAGIAEIKQGIATGNTTQIIVGVGILLVGLFAKEN